MGRRTPLFQTHVGQGAKIVDFGRWDMPLHYGSQLEEHHAVRNDAGMFDVSHMCVIDLAGARAREFLQHLLANDVGKLPSPGKALYSCMLNEAGGVLDDLIVYFLSANDVRSAPIAGSPAMPNFRLVVNAGTRDKDLAWIRARAAEFSAAPAPGVAGSIRDDAGGSRGESDAISVRERADLAILAIQGPNARSKAAALLPPLERERALSLPGFCGAQCGDWFVARTGYTGEDGFEVMLPATDAAKTWNALRAQQIAPAGLGARDTLRLEAGMNLYGNDMDESQNPLESGLAWTVAFGAAAATGSAPRDFIGRAALERIPRPPPRRFVGLLLEERGVLRNHQRVVTIDGDGEITSGGFSPTLNRSIALARIPAGDAPRVQVEVRGKLLDARIVAPPFVRNGKARIAL